MSTAVNIHQTHAIETFTVMLARANAYRAGQTPSESMFNPRYGICDNIERCMPSISNYDVLMKIKDNVIRRLPSYSGAYHYPVRHPNPREGKDVIAEAENIWDSTNDKWSGAYGAERVIQLEEMLMHVTHHWDDRYTEKMTAAQRVGIELESTIVMHRTSNVLYLLSQDDTSTSPYFRRYDGTGDRTQCFNLTDMMIVNSDMLGKMSVAAYIRKLKKAAEERDKINAKMHKLRTEINKIDRSRALLDAALAMHHGVRRLDK